MARTPNGSGAKTSTINNSNRTRTSLSRKKYLQSNKQQTTNGVIQTDVIVEHFPSSLELNVKRNQVAYALIERGKFRTAYQDLTGKFSLKSGRGNEYILVGYHYKKNYILAELVKNRAVSVLTGA